MDGQVVRLYKDLQYGFIKSGGKDYFFHKQDFDGDWHALNRDFTNGVQVYMDFEPKMTDKGLRASEVKLSDC